MKKISIRIISRQDGQKMGVFRARCLGRDYNGIPILHPVDARRMLDRWYEEGVIFAPEGI